MDSNYQFRWEQLARHMIDDLIAHPIPKLPGIQALTVKYKVGRETVERALQFLEELGVVEPAQPGKSRHIDLSKIHEYAYMQGKSERRIFFLSAEPASNPVSVVRITYESLHAICEETGFYLSYVTIPTKPSELRALLISMQPRGVILHVLPNNILEIVHELKIPAVGIGQVSPHFPCFYIGYDTLLIQAFEQARKTGHRRITTPVWRKKLVLYEGLAEQLENYFSQKEMNFSRNYNFPFVHGTTPEDYHATLREVFRYTPPDCIIIHDLSQYLLTCSFFMKEGVCIPDDVSVILLSNDPLMEDNRPSIAHFVIFSNDIARLVFNSLMAQIDGLQSSEQTVIPLVFVDGDSLVGRSSRRK